MMSGCVARRMAGAQSPTTLWRSRTWRQENGNLSASSSVTSTSRSWGWSKATSTTSGSWRRMSLGSASRWKRPWLLLLSILTVSGLSLRLVENGLRVDCSPSFIHKIILFLPGASLWGTIRYIVRVGCIPSYIHKIHVEGWLQSLLCPWYILMVGCSPSYIHKIHIESWLLSLLCPWYLLRVTCSPFHLHKIHIYWGSAASLLFSIRYPLRVGCSPSYIHKIHIESWLSPSYIHKIILSWLSPSYIHRIHIESWLLSLLCPWYILRVGCSPSYIHEIHI